MRLRTAPYPDPTGSAGYYWAQASHRKTAIDTAIQIIRKEEDREVENSDPGDGFNIELSRGMSTWVIESLIQGAWLREYHMWEIGTKEYFGHQRLRNGNTVDWKKTLPGFPRPSHVDRVRHELAQFAATVPLELLERIDEVREQVNRAKHQIELFVTEDDYRQFTAAIAAFWEALAGLELFVPRQPI